jgi:hypothetical protein
MHAARTRHNSSDLLISMCALFGVISEGQRKTLMKEAHFFARIFGKKERPTQRQPLLKHNKIYAPCLMFLLRAGRVKVKNARTRHYWGKLHL